MQLKVSKLSEEVIPFGQKLLQKPELVFKWFARN